MGHVVRISLNRKGGWVIDAGAKWVNDNVVVVDHDEVDPYAYVISANIRRRHLSSEDKDRLIGPDDVARFTTHPVTRKVVPPPGEWPELPRYCGEERRRPRKTRKNPEEPAA